MSSIDPQKSSESRLYTFSQETKDQLLKFRLGTSRASKPQAKICKFNLKKVNRSMMCGPVSRTLVSMTAPAPSSPSTLTFVNPLSRHPCPPNTSQTSLTINRKKSAPPTTTHTPTCRNSRTTYPIQVRGLCS
jgi:hypothetical protein